MVDDIETHMHVVFSPLLEWIASIPAIRPDHLEARQLSDKRVEHSFAPFAISATFRLSATLLLHYPKGAIVALYSS
jgi:hypothetical protein